jgi:carboxymethylenebutenolidase
VLCQHIPGHDGVENDAFTLAAAKRFAANGFVDAVPFIFHWWPKHGDMKEKGAAFRDDHTIMDLQATFNLLLQSANVDANRISIVGHCWGGRVSWLGACHLRGLAACVVFYGGRIDLALGTDGPTTLEMAENIECPVAGFFGNDDSNPSPELVDKYESRLKELGVDTVFHRYDGAGHAFQNFPTPERYREVQSEAAWATCLDFLRLKSDV